jgi:hypothetical protein|nr:MAG TPA: homing endonuclease [Caudoviricetes sp.]
MKDNQQLSRKELYNYDEKLKSDFLELFLNYPKNEVIEKLNISEKDFDMLTLILKLRSKKNYKDLPNEIWINLSFIGFKFYYVSNCGRIRRLNKLKTPILTSSGYYKINLYELNKVKTFTIHRLVAYAFLGVSDLTVNHKDYNTINNHISNLEYMTMREQTEHRDLRIPTVYKQSKRVSGSKNPMAKINEELVLKIRSEDSEISHSELSRKYNLPYERIRLIRKREVWKHI